MPQEIVGGKGKRRDISDTPVVNVWKTDIIDNRDPDYHYEFLYASDDLNRDKVREKLRATRVMLKDFETGETEVHDIPAWELVRRDISGEEAAGYRSDEGKPIDSLLRHGPYVAMRIPKKYHQVLERAKEQKADGYEQRLRGGRKEEYDISGTPVAPGRGKLEPGNIRITEHPLGRKA
jgi:hypothetical protein